MTRRDLIQKVIIAGTVYLVIPPALSSCSKDETDNGTGGNGGGGGGKTITLDLTNATYAALNNAGGSVVVQNIIVANTTGGYIALSSVCTHEGCTIGYNSTLNNFPCPCHGSVYSATGSVVNGPATVAVKSYAVSKAGNILTITL
jgi:cytochrome b6-f complex iron-sulfur subunit